MAIRVFDNIKSAIQGAKSGLRDRISKKESELAADAARVADEVAILDKHASLVVTAEYLSKNYEGALSNFEALLSENPIRILVNNLRGYQVPGLEALAPLTAWDTAKRYKIEIIAELRAQTLGVAEAELEKFESAHQDVLRKHRVI